MDWPLIAEAVLMERIRLLLADDSPAILDLVVKMLKANFVITGAFTDGKSVLQEFPTLLPDVIILDISMGDVSGIEVARRLRELDCKAKLIFLTVHEDVDFVRAALAVGASGYVFKSAVNCDLVAAIYAASQNKLFYPSALRSVHW
jgi:DNA-binding NarL/FixJ family response regulator